MTLDEDHFREASIVLGLTIKIAVLVESIKGLRPTGYSRMFIEKKGLMKEYKEFVEGELEELLKKIHEQTTDAEFEYMKYNQAKVREIVDKIVWEEE